jgi:hypothetical protein
MAYNSEESEIVLIVILICGGISVICCLLVSLCYVFFPSLRGYEFRLILYMTLSDLISSIMYMIPPNSNDEICNIQGVIISFSDNLRLGFFLNMTMYLHAGQRSSEDKFKKYEKLSIILVCIISSILASIPLTKISYENSNGLCWIEVNSDNYLSGTLFRFGVFYIPLWMVICYTTWVYYLMIKNIKTLRNSSIVSGSFAKSAVTKLWLYPATLIICWLPDSIYTVIEAFDPEFTNLILNCLSLGFNAGWGFFNALAYGLTPQVSNIILRSCLRKNSTSPLLESRAEGIN